MSYQNKPSFKGQRSRYSYSSSKSYNKPKRSRGEYIDPARFVKVAKPVEQEEYQAKHTFDDFLMHPVIKKNVEARNFSTPSPIQDQAIPLGLEGKDIIGIANTGTGKTIAFAIPVLNRLLESDHAKALIIAPTRELAQQIEAELRSLGKNSGLFGTLLIGGTAMGPQLRDLRDRPRIVIGTPGRIKDHLQRGSLSLSTFSMVVLDEVDRMLDMGFVTDVREILSQLSPKHQSFFFSATLGSKVNDLIRSFTEDPITISVKTADTSESVHQNVVRFSGTNEKIEKLHDILITDGVNKILVFDETQRSVERLSKTLSERGFSVDAIHGGKSQGQRQRALSRFKNNDVNILVATDVAARGIDVVDITHVINYSVPQAYEDYVHRIGRAGRAGRTGHALTFVTQA